MKPEDILHSLVTKTTPEERAAFLDAACGQDVLLRAKVEGLLKAHESAGSFLESPVLEAQLTSAQESPVAAEQPGAVIGPYKLNQQLGEGGMGTVFMAQQTEPVKRLVALKIIKPGMDSKQVIARFEAERQALALMDHPNIAKVLDAGTTEAGRPYFVMELVKGVPITKYSDQNHLTPRQRLELFIPVCQAVQHAHQKGIIHRDLKPSNVLVALYDGKPVPKVIDFGVAKAAGPQLTERTLVTGFGTIVGTLEYMSPEQAELNQLDIDTRSDIYSLGVLLYELLTGSTPLDRKRLKEAAFTEMLRMIREEEPPKPSTRLSESQDSLPSISAQRQTEPAKLTRQMRGELDWIVMKALEKDRNRRYETANGFAMDLQRYLVDEPVQACPPSVGYRLKKAIRRNKVAVVTAALIFAALVAGVTGTTIGLVRALQAEHVAEDERSKAVAAKEEAEKNLGQAIKAADTFFTRVSESKLLDKAALQPFRKELLEEARKHYLELFNKKKDDLKLKAELGASYLRMVIVLAGLDAGPEAHQALEKGLDLVEPLVRDNPGDADLAKRLSNVCKAERPFYRHWADGFARVPGLDRQSVWQRACDLWRQLSQNHPDVPELKADYTVMLLYLGDCFFSEQRWAECLTVYQQADRNFSELARQRSLSFEYQIYAAMAKLGVAWLLDHAGDPAGGRQHSVEGVAIIEGSIREFPEKQILYQVLLPAQLDVVGFQLQTGEQRDAELVQNQVFDRATALVAKEPDVPGLYSLVGAIQQGRAYFFLRQGRMAEAEAAFRHADQVTGQAAKLFPDILQIHVFHAGRAREHGWFLGQRQRVAAGLQMTRQALHDLQLAAKDDQDDRDHLLEVGQLYVQIGQLAKILGRWQEAESAWRNAIAVQADYVIKHPNSINNLFYQLDPHAARTTLHDLLKQTCRPQLAKELARDTLAFWEKMSRQDPQRSDFVPQLAKSYGLDEDWAKAVATYDRGIAKWPKVVDFYRGRAAAFSKLQLHDKAIADHTKVLQLAPVEKQLAATYEARAQAYRALGQNDKALADLSEAIRRWPFYAEAWHWRGNFHREQQRWQEAIADYNKSIELQPFSWWNWQARAHAYVQLGEWDKAQANIDKVIAFSSDEVSYRDFVAHTRYQFGAWLTQSAPTDKTETHYREAIAIWARLAEERPTETSYRRQMAHVLKHYLIPFLQSKQRAAEAEPFWQRAVDLNAKAAGDFPELADNHVLLAESHGELAQLLAIAGKAAEARVAREKAVSAATKALEANPADATLLQARSLHFARLGKVEEASADLDRLARLGTATPKARDAVARSHHELAVIFQGQSLLKDAERHHRQALDLWLKLAEDVPTEPVYRVHAANVLRAWLAGILQNTGRSAEAEQTYRQALAEWDKVVGAISDKRRYDSDVGETYHHFGAFLVNNGKARESLLLCTKALEKWPDITLLWRTRGQAYMALKKPEKALPDFIKAIEVAPKGALISWWYLDLAFAHSALGQHDKALEVHAKNIQLWPQRWETYHWRADFHYHRQEWKHAAADYSKALELHADYAPGWHNRGVAHAGLKQWDNAIADQSKAIQLNPTSWGYWYQRGLAYASIKQWDKALVDFTKVVELEATETYNLVSFFLHHGRKEEAEKLNRTSLGRLEKLAYGAQDNARYRETLAALYSVMTQHLGQSQRAEELCTKALATWPSDAHLHMSRGRARLALQQPEKALADFMKAIENAPKDVGPWWHLDRSYAYSALKQEDKALADLTTATQRWPKIWDTWIWRGNYYRDRAQWEKAVTDYSKGLELNSPYWPGYYARAHCQAGRQRWADAVADYSKAIELGGDDVNLHHSLAWLLATCDDVKVRNPTRAVQLAKKAIELAPGTASHWTALGVAHYRTGAWKDTAEALTKSMALRNGGEATDWFFLAMAHWNLDRKPEARKWFDQAAQWMDKNASKNEELRRFRDEASQTLRIKKKES